MTRLIGLTILALLTVIPLFAAEIEQTGNAQITVDGQKFGFYHWGKDWSSFDSQLAYPHLIKYADMVEQDTLQGKQRAGTFTTAQGIFDFSETIKRISSNEMKLTFEFHSDAGISTEQLCYATEIPLDHYRKHPLVLDQQIIPADKAIHRLVDQNTLVTIALPGGILELRGDYIVHIQFTDHVAQLRLVMNDVSPVKNGNLAIHLKFLPFSSDIIDLKPVMNMGLSDPVADDQQGGWTDQGPDNDLRTLTPGRKEFAKIPFEIVDPGQNNGRACLAIRGKMRPYFTEKATVAVPEIKGRYLYLLNALAWGGAEKTGAICGEVRVNYLDGESVTYVLKNKIDTADFWNPPQLENAFVAWQGQNGSNPIGLYATQLSLDPSKTVTGLEFHSRGMVWLLLAATISSRLPGADSKQRTIEIAVSDDWLPLEHPANSEKGSILDLSSLVDAPAGKYGFLQISADGNFEFEKRPGVKTRFWGTNLCYTTNFLSADETSSMLDELVLMGYNSLRLHHFDCGTNGKWPDEAAWDRFDYLVAAAKARGLYITADLYTTRSVTLKKYGYVKQGEYKLLCYFDDEAYADLLQFSRLLFERVNPYTGLAWKDDPAIITLNLINEGTLTVHARNLTDKTRPVVEKAFVDWRERENLSGDRATLFPQFLTDTAKSFFVRMKKDLSDMGVRIPLSDQNFVLDNITQEARLSYDFVDTHFYWGHPRALGAEAFPIHTVARSIITTWGGDFHGNAAARIFGKPNVVTEWNYCHPNPYAVEEQIIFPASASLQGFDGLWHFDFVHTKSLQPAAPMSSFDIYYNPLKRLAVRIGGVIYLRGDVMESETILPYRHDLKRPGLAQLSLIAKVGMLDSTNTRYQQKPLPDSLHSEALVCKLIKDKRIPDYCYDQKKQIVKSTTGELTMNQPAQTFSVITPYSEALVLPEGKADAGKFLSVNNRKWHGVFAVISTDGVALTQSKRLLILHLTENKNVGDVFVLPEKNIQVKRGTSQIVVGRGIADLELDCPDLDKIYACSATGKRLFEVPFHRENGKIHFTAATKSPHGPIMVYEVITK